MNIEVIRKALESARDALSVWIDGAQGATSPEDDETLTLIDEALAELDKKP